MSKDRRRHVLVGEVAGFAPGLIAHAPERGIIEKFTLEKAIESAKALTRFVLEGKWCWGKRRRA